MRRQPIDDAINQSADMSSRLSIGQCATLACLLEATAPKVGNVHRGADFPDLTFTDFAASAVVIGPPLENSWKTGIGRAVLGAQAMDEMMQQEPQLAAALVALLARKLSMRLRVVGARLSERQPG